MAAADSWNQHGIDGNSQKGPKYSLKNLPKRPKKAMTGYSLFLKEYIINNRDQVSIVNQGRALMIEASAEWRRMTPAQHQSYDVRCVDDKLRYAREICKWKKQRSLLKRPASSYALFLKETWERERNSDLSVGEMGTHAAGIWNQMSEANKNVYRRRRENLAKEYHQVITQLGNGELDLNSVGDNDD